MQIETGLPKIVARQSGIHGTGVYAAEPISNGRRIIEYTGERISKEEGTKRADASPFYTFIFILDDEWDVDGAVGGNDSRFINHSCEPNCEIIIEDGRIWIAALRDIEDGEELTYDYSFERDENPTQCKCNSQGCRGIIVEVPE